MYRVERGDDYVSFEMPSQSRYVPRAVDACEDFLRERDVYESSGLTVILRELLANAIRHGNLNTPQRRVSARVEQEVDGRFKVIVEDEGAGFDSKSIDMRLPDDPRYIRKRGYLLIRALSDRLEFNPKGNRVTAYVSASALTEMPQGIPA